MRELKQVAMSFFKISRDDVDRMAKQKNLRRLVKATKYRKDPFVRWYAVCALLDMYRPNRVLSGYRDPRIVRALISALSDSSSNVRSAAVDGGIRDTSYAQALIHRGLIEQEGRILRNITIAFGGMRLNESLPVLIRILDSADVEARCEAARALGKIGDRKATEPLVAALGGPPELRREAIDALSAIGDERAAEPLWDALDRNEREINWTTAWIIRYLTRKPSADPFWEALGLSDAEQSLERCLMRVQPNHFYMP